MEKKDLHQRTHMNTKPEIMVKYHTMNFIAVTLTYQEGIPEAEYIF